MNKSKLFTESAYMKLKSLLALFLFLICSMALLGQAPVISSFSPASGTVGTLVTISGSNLSNPTAFTIGGVPAIVISNTGSQMVGMVMPGAVTGGLSIMTLSGSATALGNFTVGAAVYPKVQIGGKITTPTGALTTAELGSSIAISADGNTMAVGALNDNNQIGAAWVFVRNGAAWVQQSGKLIPSDRVGAAYIGTGIGLSADGNTLVIGGNNSAWIYTRSGGVWSQKTNRLGGTGVIGNTNASVFYLGPSVAISADGNTILIGSLADNNGIGAVWVFTNNGGTWTQQGAKLTPNGYSGTTPMFGNALALSADGNVALIGAPGDNGNIGAAWVFTRSGSAWTQQGNKLTPSDNIGTSSFGSSVALTADGALAVMGGPNDDRGQGAAWIFTRNSNIWAQQPKLVAAGTKPGSLGNINQGTAVAVNADGSIVLQAAPYENDLGATWVYTRTNNTWNLAAKLVGSVNTAPARMALSADGTNVVLGNPSDNNVNGAFSAFTNLSYPVLATQSATAVTTTTAVLNGTADDNGSPTTVGIEYSTSADMSGSKQAVLTSGNSPIASGTGITSFTGQLTGLTPGTTYYYRINGTNSVGANSGPVVSFLTLTPPVISSFTPTTTGAGATVVITGVNFQNATVVNVGGVPAASFSQVSSTTIYAVVPAGATSGSISVTNNYGTGNLSGLTIIQPPNISYVNQTYNIGSQITPLAPTNSGGVVPAGTYTQVSTLSPQNLNGSGSAFSNPASSVADPFGNTYVSDVGGIIKINTSNQAVIWANFLQNGSSSLTFTAGGIALSAVGDICLADQGNNRIVKVNTSTATYFTPTPTLFAGSGVSGSANGTGAQATFNSPAALVFDASGNLYVAEQGGNLIRKITPAGVVTTFAGSGVSGSANGTGTAASFNAPDGITIDGSGNFYVADKGNNLIRKITPGGVVSTFAGSGSASAADGAGTAAGFNAPAGLTADKYGNIFVADAGNALIRMITPAGVVSTIAGGAHTLDGIGTQAGFIKPASVAFDLQGRLTITDKGIRKLVLTGYTVSPALPPGLSLDSSTGTISGIPTSISSGTYTITAVNVYGTNSTTININTVIPPVPPGIATFSPFACTAGTTMTIKGVNILGATDVIIGGKHAQFTVTSNSSLTATITATVPAGAVSGKVIVSNPYGPTSLRGFAMINPPSITYTNNTGSFVVGAPITPITVTNTGGIVPANLYAESSTLAGDPLGIAGSADGIGTAASFNDPTFLTIDPIGNLYIGDRGNNTIRKIAPSGVVSTLNQSGPPLNGTYAYGAVAMVLDSLNNLYVSYGDGSVIKVTAAGVASTMFSHTGITGLVMDGQNNLYTFDYFGGGTKKTTPSGVTTVFSTDVSQQGLINGLTSGQYGYIRDISSFVGLVDPSGTLYLTNNYKFSTISPLGVTTDLAGGGTAGYKDGTGAAAQFGGPRGATVDAMGNVWVPDYVNNRVRKITPAGVVTTVAGNGIRGPINGVGNKSALSLSQMVIDNDGNLYFVDENANQVRKLTTTGYSVTPDLPAGLSIDRNGTISGTPTVITPGTPYTITAYNLTGSSSSTVTFATTATTTPPVITSFSPATGAVGTLVTITGSNFNYPTTYKIGGVNATIVSNSGTQMVAMVMPGATNDVVTIGTAAGTAVGPSVFTVTPTLYPAIQKGNSLPVTPTGVAITADGDQAFAGGRPFGRANGQWSGLNKNLALAVYDIDYLYNSNTGYGVAMSADGNTVAVSARYYTLTNGSGAQLSAVWILKKINGLWIQQGKPFSGTGEVGTTSQGTSIAISADGNTIIEGAPGDNSNQGAVWIFTQNNGVWSQVGNKLVGTGAIGAAKQGYTVGISADGNTVIVGGPDDNSGIGAAWVYTRTGNAWIQQGNKLVSNELVSGVQNRRQAVSVALNADGNTAAIGVAGGAFMDGTGLYIFTRTNGNWTQQGTRLSGNSTFGPYPGSAVALSADGNTAVAGGVGGQDQLYNSFLAKLGFMTFTRTGASWSLASETYISLDRYQSYYSYPTNYRTQSMAITQDGATAIMGSDWPSGAWIFTAVMPAAATTQVATNIAISNATLNGTVSDGGNTTTVTMEYGTSPTLNGSAIATLSTGTSPIASGTGNVSFTSNLSGLSPATTYYYRINCVSSTTTLHGAILSFTTLALPPTVISFTPATAARGTTVTITGTNFTGATGVGFGGTAATSFAVVSPTTITAVVGGGASGNVSVTNSGGTATLGGFSFVPLPIITAGGSTTFLNGGSVVLTANPSTGYTYQWIKDGTPISGATSATCTATQSGSYTVTVTLNGVSQTSAATIVATIFILPASNFTIAANSATCRGSANGTITITAAQNLSYTATITGGAVNATYPFTTSTTINNLAAGTYNVCFTVAGQSSYQQCFTVVITEPKDLAVYTAVNNKVQSLTLTLDGGDVYHVTLNGVTTSTTGSNITLALDKGINELMVTTDKPCQGVIQKQISISDDLVAYPNPFTSTLNVNLGDDVLPQATLEIYSINGVKVYSRQFTNQSGIVQLDLSNLKPAMYVLKIKSANPEKTYKIVKQ